MQQISNLFSKYEEIKLEPTGTLFDVDLRVAKKHRVCPFCFCKLYEMRNKPFMYCRSKKHRNKFIISKDKM